MHLTLVAYWPINEHPLTLGNLLTFRKELEILAELRNIDRSHLYFSNMDYLKVPYLKEALSSCLAITTSAREVAPLYVDWPPSDPVIKTWSYGSLQRISLLHQNNQIFPVLSWPADIKREAVERARILRKGFQRLIAVHLKQQSLLYEESNADMKEWAKFFKENPQHRFVLLGKDPVDANILRLDHVLSAEMQGWSLSLQLALCARADAFLGMASGICCAAIFSEIPYVIFKHPKHHPDEMRIELSDGNKFPFSKEFQQLWRRKDNVDNLCEALQMIEGYG